MQIAISHSNPAKQAPPVQTQSPRAGNAIRNLPGLRPVGPEVTHAGMAPIDRVPELPASTQCLFAAQLPPIMPRLRAFGYYLSRDHDRTDDLVQETMLKALRFRCQFTPGSNLAGWLMTILRNEFYTMMRKRREVEDVDNVFSSRLSVSENQIHSLDLKETMSAIQFLPDGQQSAVLLVAVLGYTCQEAADRCKTKAGAIKSRLNRGRAELRRDFFDLAPPQ